MGDTKLAGPLSGPGLDSTSPHCGRRDFQLKVVSNDGASEPGRAGVGDWSARWQFAQTARARAQERKLEVFWLCPWVQGRAPRQRQCWMRFSAECWQLLTARKVAEADLDRRLRGKAGLAIEQCGLRPNSPLLVRGGSTKQIPQLGREWGLGAWGGANGAKLQNAKFCERNNWRRRLARAHGKAQESHGKRALHKQAGKAFCAIGLPM